MKWNGSIVFWIVNASAALAETTLRSYAIDLLHFRSLVGGVHHTDVVTKTR